MKKNHKKAFALSPMVMLGVIVGLSACADPGDGNDDEWEDEPSASTEEELRSAVNWTEKAATGYQAGSRYAIKLIRRGCRLTPKATGVAVP